MNLDNLHILSECVARGSFAAAARALALDPSQVSRVIAGLEAELGFRLFERSTRAIVLTEAGRMYHDRTATLVTELSDAAAAARDMTDQPKGRLRVAASTAFGERIIVPMLRDFMQAHPEVEIDLVLSDAQADLLSGRIDVAVRLARDAPPDTIVSKLCATRYRVVAAKGYKVSAGAPSALSSVPVVRFAYPGFRDLWLFRKDGQIQEVPVTGRVEITSAGAVLDAVLAGIGPGLLADWMIGDALERGELKDLFPDYDVTATGFETAAWLLTPSRRYQPLKARCFIAALRAHVEKQTYPRGNL